MTPVLALALAAAAPPPVAWKPCAAALPKDVKCGTVVVPEDRRRPDSRRVGLNIMVLPALGKASLPPLVDVEGGPGNASTNSVGFYAVDGQTYRANRDVLLVDQRGTGGSNLLACPELATNIDRPMYPLAKVQQCRKRLSRNADLRFYGTADAVEDLDEVRRALGYAQLDLTGISYGTTFALRYIATYPQHVRAAVLIAPVPANARPPRYHAALANAQLQRLFADCHADPKCNAQFAPEQDLAKALKRLGPEKREPFMEAVRTAMYVPTTARTIPYALHSAAGGDFGPWRKLSSAGRPGYGDGMYLAITCGESFAGMDVAAAGREARSTPFGDYRLRRQNAACNRWAGARPSADHFAPVRASVPVLLLTGTDDPVAANEWADQIARGLPAARVIPMPGAGHGLDGIEGLGECFDKVALQFLAEPQGGNLDATCFNALGKPSFKVADAAARP